MVPGAGAEDRLRRLPGAVQPRALEICLARFAGLAHDGVAVGRGYVLRLEAFLLLSAASLPLRALPGPQLAS